MILLKANNILISNASFLQVPLEVFEYIDAGRNPQLFTKDCMEKAHTKNEEVKGKIDAYRSVKKKIFINVDSINIMHVEFIIHV